MPEFILYARACQKGTECQLNLYFLVSKTCLELLYMLFTLVIMLPCYRLCEIFLKLEVNNS